MAELPQLRQANVMIRGQYDKPGEAVSRGVPAAFHPLPKKDTYDRRDLAAWLLSPANPLTTRVAAATASAPSGGTASSRPPHRRERTSN